jgi:putative ABC transport system permease protein
MFRNAIKTAVRSLLKNKGFTFLNIFGLTLGLLTCMYIIFYVSDELSFDRYNIKADRIFRVNTDLKTGATITSRAITTPAIAAALVNNFPEVEKTVRFFQGGGQLFKNGEEFVQEDKVVYCDPDIFDVFTLPMIEGDPNTALKEPNSIVITESTAKRYFNRTQVLGQNLIISGDSNTITFHKITGVIRDIPKQSHFHFDFFLSMADVQDSYLKTFASILPFNTYVLLKTGVNYKSLDSKLPGLVMKNLDFEAASENHGDYYKLNLTPLTAIHLQSNRTDELENNGNEQYVQIFSAIALFILLIAGINFINLSTARSSDRAREVGVRKILGSPRKYLIGQFLIESMIVTIIAACLAVIAGWILLPLFNQLSGKNSSITSHVATLFLPSFIAAILVVGILAGIYPAFFLSSFRPAQVLKGKLIAGIIGSSLRNFLVVTQFSISIFLIIGTLVIYNQLQYMQNKDVGFNRNEVVVIKNINALQDNQVMLLKQDVKQLPGVVDATLSSFIPTGNRRWTNWISTSTDGIQTQFWPVDEDYLKTLDIKLSEGRGFSTKLPTDSSAIIVNETASRMLGISADPLNQTIYKGDLDKEFHTIGVVKDFNFSSLKDNITPVVLLLVTPAMKKYEGDGPDNLSIKVNADHLPDLLAELENKWKSFSPRQRFTYYFMDEEFDAIYRSEQRMGKVFLIFTSLALIIACLGLFGLAAYAAENRSKEISIRKVLGASILTIIRILSKDFIRLIFISILISFPIAWFSMQKWLQDFAYRINIHWWILAIAGFLALLIAFITISFQSVKAANVNPVERLRSE